MAENSSSQRSPISQEDGPNVALIEEMLRCRLGHRVRDLRISVEPHGLVITGYTTSYYDKQMAQHLVREMSSLGVADNRIVVNSGTELTGGGQGNGFQTSWAYGDIVEGRHRPRRRHHVRM
jgi:hypothetical protein